MKIVLIGTKSMPKSITGQSICFDLLLKGLNDNNVSYSFISLSEQTSKINKILKYFLGGLKLFFLYILHFKSLKLMYLTISQSKIGFARDFMFIWISVLFGKRKIVHLHGGNFKNFYLESSTFLKFLIRKTYNQCDSIIVLSKEYLSLFDFVDNYKEKVVAIPNGIPSFENEMIIDKDYNPEKPIILYLSNLIESKGYLDVLKATKLLIEKYNVSPKVYFCGKFLSNSDDVTFKNVEDAKAFFFDFIKENKLEENVFYEGLVSGAYKDELLKKASFLVLPTNYNAEGQPLAVIEGLKYGCVLITTKYRDLEHMNSENHTGFFVKYKDSEAIADCVSKVDDKLFKEMSSNSQLFFKENYSFAIHYNKISRLFYEYSK